MSLSRGKRRVLAMLLCMLVVGFAAAIFMRFGGEGEPRIGSATDRTSSTPEGSAAVSEDLLAERPFFSEIVRGSSEGTSGFMFYCIEEMHDSVAAQREISSIIHELAAQGFRTVLVEAPPDMTLPESTALFSSESMAEVADAALQSGWLDGLSHAYLFTDLRVVGVDAQEHRAERSNGLVELKRGSEAVAREAFSFRYRSRGDLVDALAADVDRLWAFLDDGGRQAVEAAMTSPQATEPGLALEPAVDALREAADIQGIPTEPMVARWNELQQARDAEREASEALDSLLEKLNPLLVASDEEMVRAASDALRADGESVGILLFGTMHTAGILNDLGERGHGYVLLTPRSLREDPGSEAIIGPPTSFQKLWSGALRPEPRLSAPEAWLEFQACVAVNTLARQLDDPTVLSTAGSPVSGTPFTHGPVLALLGEAEPSSSAMAVQLDFESKSLIGVVRPWAEQRQRALQMGDRGLEFQRLEDFAALQARLERGVEARILRERYIDLATAWRTRRGAALSFYRSPGGEIRCLTLSHNGRIAEMDQEVAARLHEALTRFGETEGLAVPLEMALRGLFDELVRPLLGRGPGAVPELIIRSESEDLRWHKLARLSEFGREARVVLASAEESGRAPASVASVAAKLSRSPEYRYDAEGRVANLVILLNRPPGSAVEIAEYEALVARLRNVVSPEHVLFDADRGHTLAALEHAGELGDAVVLQIAHTTQDGAGGLVLGNGEVVRSSDFAEMPVPSLWHSSLGSCRLAQVGEGELVREGVKQGGGLVGVAPKDLSETQVLQWLRGLLQMFQRSRDQHVSPIDLPYLMPTSGEAGGGRPPGENARTLLIGHRAIKKRLIAA